VRNAKILVMLPAAAFSINLYSANTPEIKYDEAWSIHGNHRRAFQCAADQNIAAAQYDRCNLPERPRRPPERKRR